MANLLDMPSSVGSDALHLRERPGSSCGQVGGSLDAFQALLDGWNACQNITGSHSGGVQIQCVQEPPNDSLAMISVADQVDEQLRLLSRDTRRIAEEITDARRLLGALEDELEQARARERVTALDLLRTLLQRYQLRPADFAELLEPQAAVGSNQVDGTGADGRISTRSRYIGPGGEVWHGRGRYPKWLRQLLDEGGHLSDLEYRPELK